MSRINRIIVAALFAVTAATGAIAAGDYPNRAVRLVVGYPPGGTTDVLARLITSWLTDHMGQQFVVENKPGGGNNIGTEYVVNARARRLHDAARESRQRHQRDALQEPQLQLRARHRRRSPASCARPT